jgi:hypothetical protein
MPLGGIAMLGQHTGAAVIGSTMFPILHRLVPGAKRLPVAVPCTAAFTASSTACSAQSLERQAVSHSQRRSPGRSLAAQLVRAALTLVLAILVLTALILAALAALVLAALVLAALTALILTALATGAEVILGALLALLDLVAEAATCVLVC